MGQDAHGGRAGGRVEAAAGPRSGASGPRVPSFRPRAEPPASGGDAPPSFRGDRPRPRADAPSGREGGHGGNRDGQAARGAPRAPAGTVWLYGLHPIAAALGNRDRRLRRLLLTEDAEAALDAEHPKPWPLGPERTDRARIDALLGRDVVHQGAALLADPLPTPPLASCLERPGPVLVLDQISDPRNVGAILRSAAAFGAAFVLAQDRNAPDETGALAKAASGALETMPLLRAVNIARSLVALRAAGLWIVGLDAGGSPLAGPAFAARRVALVLGAEGSGLRRLTRESCDEIAGLSMRGGAMESLNVSVAAGIALYEIARRA